MAKTVIASANRIAGTVNSEVQEPSGGPGGLLAFLRALIVYLDITVAGGTAPTLDVKIQRKLPNAATFVDVPGASFAQKTGVGQDILVIADGIAELANKKVSDFLGGRYRAVAVVAGGAGANFTYSVDVEEVPQR